ncbi:MAG: helix-turn-helix transcriptional regulator [Oscillospiraceae bacterium]|nr:helix-turn-helix transcriptional regulator [Oscillospiraceae bacterium]
MNVAQRLIYFREKRGITTNKLANLAGVSQSHLREIELGQRNPTVETLSFFCEALGISLEEFFRENECEINSCLMSAIKRLSDKQQQNLADFLNSMHKE